jgi:uncharacterized protein YceH (UPF0502 family)
MSTILTDIETRVLGSLIEKQVTTPEYYPLTLNALTLACNQKNNRYPVTSYTENQVSDAVERLREKNLAYVFYGSTSRVPKYKHVVPEVMHLSHPEVALMCVLMLRGAQTLGELRGNAARLHDFSGLEEVEQTLNGLISRDEPLVARRRASRVKRKAGSLTYSRARSTSKPLRRPNALQRRLHRDAPAWKKRLKPSPLRLKS